jgi:hypothetical protein
MVAEYRQQNLVVPPLRKTVTCNMLQDSNLQVRTYVHGTYYSLLSRKYFQDLAHERGLADMLMAGVLQTTCTTIPPSSYCSRKHQAYQAISL